MQRSTHYQSLKVAEDAPQAVIVSAHHALSQALHRRWRAGREDETAVAEAQMLESAYAVLSDPERRAAYDEMLRQQRAPSPIGVGGPVVHAGHPGGPNYPSSHEVEAATPEPQSGGARFVSWLVSGVSILGILIAGAVGKVLVRELMSPKPSHPSYPISVPWRSDSSAGVSHLNPVEPAVDWVRREVTGISLELPGKPVAQKVEVPETARGLISVLETHALQFGGAEIGINHAEYLTEDTDLNGGVEAMLKYLKAAPGITDVESKTNNVVCDGVPALRVKATFTRLGAAGVADSLSLARGRNSWSVVVVASPSVATTLADRIFKSMQVPKEAAPIAATTTPPINWKRHEAIGISLELPTEPKPVAMEVPKDLRGSVLKMEGNEAPTGEVKIMIGAVHYAEDVAIDLEGAVRSSFSTAMERPGASDLTSTVTKLSRDGAEGRIAIADYHWAGIEEATHTLMLARDHKLFQVVILGPREEVTRLGDRIFPSVRLVPAQPDPDSSGHLAAVGWERRKFSGITLELPGGVTPSEKIEPQKAGGELRQEITSTSRYGAVSILLTHDTYAHRDADLDAATDRFGGSTNALKQMEGFSRSVDKITQDGMPARRLKMCLPQTGGTDLNMQSLFFAKGEHLWRVTVMGPSKEVMKVSDRILAGVRVQMDAGAIAASPIAASERAPGDGALDAPGPVAEGWQRHGFAGLTLDLPKGMKVQEKEEVIADKKYMRRNISDYVHFDGLEMSVNYWEASGDDAHIDGAVELYMKVFKGGPRGENPQASVTNIRRDGVSGRMVKATFSRDGVDRAYGAIFLTHRQHLWFVTVFGAPSMVDKLGAQILEGVRLKGFPAPADAVATSTARAPASSSRAADASSSLPASDSGTRPVEPGAVPGQTQHFSGITLWLPDGLVPVENEKAMPAESGFVKNVACKLWWGKVGIQITHVEHAEKSPSLDRAIEGIVEDYRRGLGAADILTRDYPFDGGEASGRLVNLTCTGLKVPTSGQAVILTQGRHYWQIVAIGPREESIKVAKMIVTSVKLDQPPVENWKRRSFSGISLEVPASIELKEQEEKLEPGSSLTKSVHSLIKIERVVVSLQHLASSDEDLNLSLEGATEHALASARKSPKRRLLSSKVRPITCDGHPANIVETVDEEEGHVTATHAFLLTQKSHLWKVQVVGSPDDVPKVSERVLRSIRMTSGAASDPVPIQIQSGADSTGEVRSRNANQ